MRSLFHELNKIEMPLGNQTVDQYFINNKIMQILHEFEGFFHLHSFSKIIIIWSLLLLEINSNEIFDFHNLEWMHYVKAFNDDIYRVYRVLTVGFQGQKIHFNSDN